MRFNFSAFFVLFAIFAVQFTIPAQAHASDQFRYYDGKGDGTYIELLNTARAMFDPNPALQNLPMLYTPVWNGFVEGPTWGAWWIQNSYGPTYCVLPFLGEPYITFLMNSHDLWFDQMGDGKRAGNHGYVAPDGSLCDAAAPGLIHYRQGDGRHAIHDWGMEFTAAGLLMQSELMLIRRRTAEIAHYLPKLERCAEFIESRRDPDNNLFLAGPAGNLLAPSYAGWMQPDGTFKMAYLTGLSITYIAALDRLIEVEKLAGNNDKAALYTDRRDRAREGLANVTTDEGYFIKSLDPDGTRHGVYGAEKHGYFEASPNHDAIAFRVVDDAQARRIYDKIVSIPQLRRHHVIQANEPSLDDMYELPTSWLWQHGTWVNGGHWSTCEARMVMAYYRLGAYDDARKSMEHMLGFARQFRMDNPLVDFGAAVYQPKEPINITYDAFGPLAAFVRGLFEYIYTADALTLIPHIPPGITRLEQRFPIYFGEKRVFLAAGGSGPVTAVRMNGENWSAFDSEKITLSYESLPETAFVLITLGNEDTGEHQPCDTAVPALPGKDDACWSAASDVPGLNTTQLRRFHAAMEAAELGQTYEAAHARLALEYIRAIWERRRMQQEGKIAPLPETSQAAADQSYIDTAARLYEGLVKTLDGYADSTESHKTEVYKLWTAARSRTVRSSDVD